ncbi:MAG: hypothetical protein B7Z26_11275, partial [Asticcacaulis sp. 32-58-5]
MADGSNFQADPDTLYGQAVYVVARDRKASTSYIQRRLEIGFNAAAALLERMEREGVVSRPSESGKREILISPPDGAAPFDPDARTVAEARLASGSEGFHPDVLNTTAQSRLKTIVERIERLEEDKAALMADMKEVYLEAKGEGFDVKIIRKIIRLRKQDTAKRQEEEALLD